MAAIPNGHLLSLGMAPSLPPQHRRRRGVTKFFNSLKGFGFVVDQYPEELGGQEVFCHFSAISGKGGFRSLAEGEEVEYELVQGPKGFQAANLTGPGGRNVVGDPKARLTKPPTFMPFSPLSMPLSSPYSSDPYQQQHPGVYAASPYTQHVLYVPANGQGSSISLPASQYPYSSGPAQQQTHQHQPHGSSLLASPPTHVATLFGSGPSGGSYSSPQYPFQGLEQQNGVQYSTSRSVVPPSHRSGGGGSRDISASFGALSLSPAGGAYGDVRRNDNGAIGGGHGGMGQHPNAGIVGGPPAESIAFAPFNSPPSFANPPLFGNQGPASYASSSSPPMATFSNQNQAVPYGVASSSSGSSHPRSVSSSANGTSISSFVPGGAVGGVGAPQPSGNSLFGGSPGSSAGPIGAPRSNASGAGTPRDERRGTPLGNGSLSGSGPFGAPVLYASSGTGDRDFSS